MDDEKTLHLISLLQDYPSLWKKQNKDFMNRDVRRKNFNEIAEQLHVTEEECRKRLKHLKDKMREVCSKLPKTASGQPAFQAGEEIVRWQFYKPLLFMKDQFIGRQLSGSFHENQTAGTSQSQDLDGDDDEESLSSHPGVETTADNTTSSRSATPVAASKRPHEGNGAQRPMSSKKSRQTDKFLDIEQEKLNTVKQLMKEDEPKDEWRAYVDFLVHELRMIKNPRLKISVRNGISKLVGDTIIQQLSIDEQQHQQQQQVRQQSPLAEPPQQQGQGQGDIYYTMGGMSSLAYQY